MSIISKINGYAFAKIAKFNGVANASIAKAIGVDAPVDASYTSANSLLFDGTNERANTSLTMTTDVGSVSLWFKFGQTVGTDWLFIWHNYSTAGDFNDGFMDVRLQNNSNSPSARHLIFTYKNTAGSQYGCSIKTGSSNHGTGYSRWKYNTEDLTGFSSHERFEYNANRLTQAGSHPYSPAEAAEHGWHHFVATWDVNETYVGKDAQAAHKYRPTASDDGTTTTHTGTMRIYMDGVLRNFGQSRYPSYNYQRTPEGMTETTATINEITIGGLPNGNGSAHGNIDDVACFDVKLSDAAVTAMYNSGAPTDLTSNSGDYTNSSDLTGYWKFDETSGTSIADSSTNSNNLTLVNSPTFDAGDAPS
tara:strand:- start:535 stop:1620 length:1086 start_codon:yes stop_codon:yes gene_type:complete